MYIILGVSNPRVSKAHMYHVSKKFLIAYTKRDNVKDKLIIEGPFLRALFEVEGKRMFSRLVTHGQQKPLIRL